MPNVGEGITEGTVTKWLKREGDAVRRDEPVVEIETDKAIVEIPSPWEGQLTRILVREDETVPVGAPIAEFEVVGAPAPASPPPPGPSETPSPSHTANEDPSIVAAGAGGQSLAPPAGQERARHYSPAVFKVASEHNIDLSRVEGTGSGGRVTRADVQRVIEQPAGGSDGGAEPEAVELPAVPSRQPEPGSEAGPDVERVRLTPTRRTIARHMTQSHQTIPAVWMVVEADVTNLVALRNRVVDEFEREEGVRLTYFPLFVRAIVAALKQHPLLNATYTDEGIEVHRSYHMGIAMAAESGLVVPVVRDAQRKSATELARELAELGGKARERRLTVGELHGATFTIDNTGAFGSMISNPLIPIGQVAIITTEVVRRELRVADDGSFATRSVMNLCISFDHRALDGAQAGRFMQAVTEQLEAVRPDDPLL